MERFSANRVLLGLLAALSIGTSARAQDVGITVEPREDGGADVLIAPGAASERKPRVALFPGPYRIVIDVPAEVVKERSAALVGPSDSPVRRIRLGHHPGVSGGSGTVRVVLDMAGSVSPHFTREEMADGSVLLHIGKAEGESSAADPYPAPRKPEIAVRPEPPARVVAIPPPGEAPIVQLIEFEGGASPALKLTIAGPFHYSIEDGADAREVFIPDAVLISRGLQGKRLPPRGCGGIDYVRTLQGDDGVHLWVSTKAGVRLEPRETENGLVVSYSGGR